MCSLYLVWNILPGGVSYVFEWAVSAFHLVYVAVAVFVFLRVLSYYILYCVSCPECYF
jgi:hypothetical protein